MMTVTWGGATDCGRLRERNEDGMLARPPVFLVADGMGGHAAREVASELLVQQFGELASRLELLAEDVAAALQQANAASPRRAADSTVDLLRLGHHDQIGEPVEGLDLDAGVLSHLEFGRPVTHLRGCKG